MPVRRVTLAAVFVFALLATGCATQNEQIGSTPSTTGGSGTSTESVKTTAPPVEETTRLPEAIPEEGPPDVAEVVAEEIDAASIRRHMVYLTGIAPAPLAGGAVTITERGSEEGRRATAEYLKQSFEKMGIPARIIEFTSDSGRGFNVEATLHGTEGKKHLWMTAHLDSVSNAGANDDASGLASILMNAKTLKRLEPEHTVHFVAYDLEEVGLVGSSQYMESVVEPLREREGDGAIIGNLHSDMIGYEADEFDAVMGTCGQAGPIDDALRRASRQLDSPIFLGEYCLGRSDHQHFWDAGLHASVLTDGTQYVGYPWYHQPGDTVDKLNMFYLRSMIQLTTAATALLAAPPSAA